MITRELPPDLFTLEECVELETNILYKKPDTNEIHSYTNSKPPLPDVMQAKGIEMYLKRQATGCLV